MTASSEANDCDLRKSDDSLGSLSEYQLHDSGLVILHSVDPCFSTTNTLAFARRTSLYAYSFTSRLTTLSSGPFYLGIKNITLLKKYLCLEGGDGSLTFYSYTRFWEDVSTVKNNNADAGHSVYIPTHELYKPPVPFQKGLAIIKDSPDMMRVIRRVSNDILTECYVNDCWKVIETRECKGEEEDCIPTKVGFKDGRGCNIIDNENLGPGTAQLIKDISTLNNPQSGLINKDYIIVTNENGVCLWEEKVVGGGGKWRKVKLFEGEGCKIVGGRGRVEGVEFKR